MLSKKRYQTLALLVAIQSCAGAAEMAIPDQSLQPYVFFPYGWYQGMRGGVTSAPSTTVSNGTNRFDLNYDKDYNIAFQMGYQNCHWRYEAELGYWRNRIDSVAENSAVRPTPSGKTDVLGLFGNAYYEFLVLPRINLSPYVGAGVGAVVFRNNIDTSVANQIRGNNHRMAYQLAAGVGYKLTESFVVDLDYRYLTTMKGSFNGRDNTGANITALGHRFKTHTINLGFVYRFF